MVMNVWFLQKTKRIFRQLSDDYLLEKYFDNVGCKSMWKAVVEC